MNTILNLSYKEISDTFENYFHNNLPSGQPLELYEAANHILKIPGKRIRPMLSILTGLMFDGNMEDLLPIAMGVELYHNSTLVHYDIMDAAEVRRGVPTVHAIYGESNAINAGNLLTNAGYGMVLKYQGTHLNELIETYNKVTIEVIEGQAYDMTFEDQHNVSKEVYLKMIALKTSVLLASACKMGAIASNNAMPEDVEKVYQFGLNLGISFQIKDDYLDAFGNMEKVGKRRGGDIIRDKKTQLMIEAHRLANDTQKAALNSLSNIENEDKKVALALSVIEETGAKSLVYQTMEKYYKKALNSLDSISISAIQKETLLLLANKVYNRDY